MAMPAMAPNAAVALGAPALLTLVLLEVAEVVAAFTAVAVGVTTLENVNVETTEPLIDVVMTVALVVGVAVEINQVWLMVKLSWSSVTKMGTSVAEHDVPIAFQCHPLLSLKEQYCSPATHPMVPAQSARRASAFLSQFSSAHAL